MPKQIYNLIPGEVLEKLNSSLFGISNKEAGKRLKEFGFNAIGKKANWKWLKLIVGQFKDVLVWILLVAAGLSLIFHEYRDTNIILIIVLINAIIGFFQEFKAERILEKIRNLTTEKALVLRDNKKNEIDSKLIVPGDIIFISSGDNIPADGYLLESYELRINSFVLTGESRPKKREAKVISGKDVHMSEIDNMVFMGETVAGGEAKFVVTGTGMNTELGKIANLTQKVEDDPTPLQKKMKILGRNITVLSIAIGILVLIVGHYSKLSLYQNFLFALALSVSIVPEGLPAAMSVALSLGMKRLLKKNVLTKKLNAVETLGSVTTICSDKTGTITKNELTVTKIAINNQIIELSGNGYEPKGDFYIEGEKIDPLKVENLEMLFKIGTLCNGANLKEENGKYSILGDPTEGAIIVAGRKYNKVSGFFEMGENKVGEIPFSSEKMRMSVMFKNNLNKGEKGIYSYVKGSPDVMVDLCSNIMIGEKIRKMTAKDKSEIKEIYNLMSEEALRVLAFAFRNLKIEEEDYENKSDFESDMNKKAEKNLTWVGMMAMIDPPRKDVEAAIEECQKLGVKVIMITGDYEITAKAIAAQVGLTGENTKKENLVISGKELEMLGDNEIYRKIKEGVRIFARITPAQKLRIASILKSNKEIIAMTGDGVNDAPALKKADIGVAMGIVGTDVSKEASDMILMNDDFASIVNGIREGRTIYQNIKKFVYYVLTSNVSEFFTVVIGVIMQIPAPLTAVQILAVDLGTDVLPSLSLGMEPPEPESNKKVSMQKDGIIGMKGFWRLIYNGMVMAVGAVVTFLWSMIRGGWEFGHKLDFSDPLYIKSTAAAYAVISMTQMANLMQARSEKFSPFKIGFFRNKYAIGSILISVGILLCFIYMPFMQRNLHMAPIDCLDWLMVVVWMLVVFLLEEGRKSEKK